ncbi:CAP-Gly domain-containing linker protein 1 [Folsomia candida]|uniref:CAP-Gly domain-containing linker protein 1 n=2 Tax=Folsomia candida TaxID=158441 RepID=A0A226DE07_FOLCA|nr:CAP-Gly domain-containing linker protein 1 [Folsomia candida]
MYAFGFTDPSYYGVMDPSSSSLSDLMIGDVIYINGEGDWRGKICFLGSVQFAKGDWAGVALDHPMGHHDGTAHHRRYFQCPPNHGIFTRIHRLSRKMLIPETLNGEKLGLTKFQREYSASPEPILHPRSKSNSRESSPFGSGSLRSVSFSPDESGGRGRSPTPPISREQAQLKVGDRVIVKSSVGDAKVGTLKFLGTVEFEEGVWAGIELSYPIGKNDGTIRGREYFRCEHPYGLFVPLHKVESSPANKLGKKMGTRENLYAVMSSTRGVRAGSYEDYY